jgi:ketosteroid isomerase-like protein
MSTTADTSTALAANKAVVQRFFAAFNDQTPDVFDEVISPDYVDYGHEPPGRGPQGARDDYNGARSAFSNVVYTIDDMIAEGDRVAARWTATLTAAAGDEEGAASGGPLTATGISIYVLANGQITETRHEVNVSGQLGG